LSLIFVILLLLTWYLWTATKYVSVCFMGCYNCHYSENGQKLNHQCEGKCQIINRRENSVGEVSTDGENDDSFKQKYLFGTFIW